MSILDPGEKLELKRKAIYKKEKVELNLTNIRLLILRKGSIELEVKYNQVDKIRYTKKDIPNPDEKTVVKFQIQDPQENKFEISFKGVDAQKNLQKAIRILKAKQEEARANNAKEAEKVHQDEINARIKKIQQRPFYVAKIPTESVIESEFLIDHETIKQEFEYYVISQHLVNQSMFMNNFRGKLTEVAAKTEYQQAGYSTKFLSEVAADDKSRGNQFLFTINDSIKRQILRKKPQINSKYAEYYRHHFKKDEDGISPEDENNFWKQYFSAQLLDTTSKSRKKHGDNKDSNIFDNIKLKDSVKFNEKSRMKRFSILSPSVQPVSLYESLYGFGHVNKELLPMSFQETVDAYNIHSELSLIENKIIPDTTISIPDDQELQVTPFVAQEQIPDLSLPKEVHRRDLTMKNDISKPEPALITDCDFRREATKFAREMNEFENSFFQLAPPPKIQPREAEYLLRDYTGERTMNPRTHQSSFARNLEIMRQLKTKQQILLYLFWTNYLDSNSKTKEASQKAAETFHDIISKFKDDLNDRKQRLPKDEDFHILNPLFEEMNDANQEVLNLYKKTTAPAFEGFFF